MKPERQIIGMGAAFAGLAVILGAFGAHSLKERFVEGGEAWWQTGSHYMIVHALGIIALGFWGRARVAPWLFAVGILLFSGSLFTMSLTGLRWLGAVTPFGGLCFIAGWTLFAISAFKTPYAD